MLARTPGVLVTALILSALAQIAGSTSAGFSFADSCVESCVGDSGCGTNDPKCMCNAAKGNLMETVLVCMFWHCSNELREADSTFLEPLQSECSHIGETIPQKDIQAADKVASSLASKLAPATTKTTTTTTYRPATTTASTSSKQQTTISSSASGVETASAPPTTSTTDMPTSQPTTVSPSTTAVDGGPSPTSSAAQTSAASGQNSSPNDSNPFDFSSSSVSRPRACIALGSLAFVVALAWT